jgi:hypothetical protein
MVTKDCTHAAKTTTHSSATNTDQKYSQNICTRSYPAAHTIAYNYK